MSVLELLVKESINKKFSLEITVGLHWKSCDGVH